MAFLNRKNAAIVPFFVVYGGKKKIRALSISSRD